MGAVGLVKWVGKVCECYGWGLVKGVDIVGGCSG